MVMNYTQTKCQEFLLIIKQDIHVQKMLAKNLNFQFLAFPHYDT